MLNIESGKTYQLKDGREAFVVCIMPSFIKSQGPIMVYVGGDIEHLYRGDFAPPPSPKRSYMTGPFWIIESIDGGEVYDIHTPAGIDGFRSTYESALEQALKLANAEVGRLTALLAEGGKSA